MSILIRFGIGGLGGLLPPLATLVTVDLSSIANLIDNNGFTLGLCVGYAIRVLGLFALGGIMAALSSEIRSPLALVQIGIAAPALITSYITGAAILKSQLPASSSNSSFLFTSAYAGQSHATENIVLADGFLSDLVKGFQPGLGTSADSLQKISGPPPEIPIDDLNEPFRVTNPATDFCLTVPAAQVKSPDEYNDLVKSFPQPSFTVEPGVCGP